MTSGLMNSLTRITAAATFALFVAPSEARAQDAFGFEPGISSGALYDPISAHSPWQSTRNRFQGSLFSGYASDPVYACAMNDDGECVGGLENWVQDDW
ncbi:MAG: hypothetical protein CL927_00500, partial [Deltaproteobacteria bacterium]|nr:hypothetical protein [Deltaproteobacteria bacterium]